MPGKLFEGASERAAWATCNSPSTLASIIESPSSSTSLTTKSFANVSTAKADLAATLYHPHIVAPHDWGEFDERLWIAMDYVHGSDTACDRQPRDEYLRLEKRVVDYS